MLKVTMVENLNYNLKEKFVLKIAEVLVNMSNMKSVRELEKV